MDFSLFLHVIKLLHFVQELRVFTIIYNCSVWLPGTNWCIAAAALLGSTGLIISP